MVLIGHWAGEDNLNDSVGSNTMVAVEPAQYGSGYVGRGFVSETGYGSDVYYGNEYFIDVSSYNFIENNYMNFEFMWQCTNYAGTLMVAMHTIPSGSTPYPIRIYLDSIKYNDVFRSFVETGTWYKVNLIYQSQKLDIYVNDVPIWEDITAECTGITGISLYGNDFEEV